MPRCRLRTVAAERGLSDDPAVTNLLGRPQTACRTSTHSLTTRLRRKTRRPHARAALTVGPRGSGVAASHGFQKPSQATQWSAHRDGFASLLGSRRAQGGQRIYDGLVVVVLLRVQQSGCRRCSLGASTGQRCLTLKILKMGCLLPAQ
jgi:hypothetical protein